MENIVLAIISCVVALACFVLSYRQFNEKGFLFNNAYIFASKQERETMNKKPHYKQSGICFLLIGIMFLINAIEVIIKTGWLYYPVVIIAVVLIVYSIISSINIERRQ